MDYTVYKMNHLDDYCSPIPVDAFIFFSTIEDRSWNIIEFLHTKGNLPNQVLSLSLNDGKKSPQFDGKCYDKILKESIRF